ncbi:B12-binding domain-containing radical SAM protein [Catenovulum sediminis]|uniref:Radical SAM protein n=1 Tax=Catenovulum sediminis TaxID=1740262 RepID=A0ABV1RGX0_9ALTE
MAIKQNLYDPNPNPFDKNKIEKESGEKDNSSDKQKLRNPGMQAKNYDPKMDIQQYTVSDPKRSADPNPRIKINYEGDSFRATKGPRNYPLRNLAKGEKRARVLFVTMDQYDQLPNFTSGPAYLAAVLENNDYYVEIFHGTCYHLGPKDLESFLLERETFDYIGIGYLSNYIHDCIEHCKAIRSASPKSKIILGGNGFTPLPGFYLAKTGADYGISGEAENSMLNLLNALSCGEDIHDLPSISYRDGDEIFVSKKREPVPDIKTIPWPAYHLYPLEKYIQYQNTGYHKGRNFFVILSSRGCPYVCNFCYRLETGHRHRPFDDFLGEMQLLNDKYNVDDFGFSDELFMTSKSHVRQFCEKMIKAMDQGDIPRVSWATTGRFNIVDKEIAEIMAAAGCRQILYGLESGDTSALERMNKKTSEQMIRDGVKYTQQAGMDVSLPCMFGNIGETEESIKKTVKILLDCKPDEYRLLRPVTPYPGSPLYEYALKNGLLKDHEDFFQLSRNPDLMTVNFTEMSNEQFYNALYKANEELITAYHLEMIEQEKQVFKTMYFKDDDSSFVPHTQGIRGG